MRQMEGQQSHKFALPTRKNKNNFKMQRKQSTDSSLDGYKGESEMVSWFIDQLGSHTFLGLVFVPGEEDKAVIDKMLKLSKLNSEFERYGGAVFVVTSLKNRRAWKKTREKLGIKLDFVVDVESGIAKYLTDMDLVRIEIRKERLTKEEQSKSLRFPSSASTYVTSTPLSVTTTSHACLFMSNDGSILHSSTPIFCQKHTSEGDQNCFTWEHFSPERTWKVIRSKLDGSHQKRRDDDDEQTVPGNPDEEDDHLDGDDEGSQSSKDKTKQKSKLAARLSFKHKLKKSNDPDRVKKDASSTSIASTLSNASTCSTNSSSSCASNDVSASTSTSSASSANTSSSSTVASHSTSSSSTSYKKTPVVPLMNSSSTPALGRRVSMSSSSKSSLSMRLRSLSVGEMFKKKPKDLSK